MGQRKFLPLQQYTIGSSNRGAPKLNFYAKPPFYQIYNSSYIFSLVEAGHHHEGVVNLVRSHRVKELKDLPAAAAPIPPISFLPLCMRYQGCELSFSRYLRRRGAIPVSSALFNWRWLCPGRPLCYPPCSAWQTSAKPSSLSWSSIHFWTLIWNRKIWDI